MLSGVLSPRCAAQNAYSGAPKPSFTQSVKQSFNKVGETFSSKPKPGTVPSDDPTLLSSKGKPSAELYLSVAKLHEESNRPAEAEGQYRHALQEFPNHLVAMLTYAHFLENHERYEDAVNLYQRAVKTHPKSASAYNNLGLCYARRKNLREATASIDQAIQIEPRNPLYRNNIAALLIEQNRLSEAYEQLRSVHGDAKAYYNLGYMLSKKGDLAAAEHHFKQALLADPTLEPAQRWLSYLQNKQNNSQSSSIDRNLKIIRPTQPAAENPPQQQVATRLAPPVQSAGPNFAAQQNPFNSPRHLPATNSAAAQEPPLPSSASPKRLPPVAVRQPVGSAISGDQPDASGNSPAAPLPPGMVSP